jgi:hypothetical protein
MDTTNAKSTITYPAGAATSGLFEQPVFAWCMGFQRGRTS